MAVQHVCDVCHQPMIEWRNFLIGRTGTTPAATQLYRPEMGRFEGETEKEVCASCYGTLRQRGVMNGVTVTDSSDQRQPTTGSVAAMPVQGITLTAAVGAGYNVPRDPRFTASSDPAFFDSPGYNAPMNT